SGYKLEGYKRALEESDLNVDETYIVEGDYSYDSGIQTMQKLLSLETPPKTVFVSSDEMALGAIHGAQDKGYNVPEDIGVFGFDNTRLATMVSPTLSTIVQPMYDNGAVSMRLLTKFTNKEDVEEKRVILPHRIVDRN